MIRCPDCDATGRGVYCAPRRCYCGHVDCYAADSYVHVRPPSVDAINSFSRGTGDAWKSREGETWIDQL